MEGVHVVSSGRANPGDLVPRRLTYGQIADDLAARIASGEYPVESKLPSYPQIAALYDVSYATAHRAITLLRDRGLVYGEPGRGVFVRDTDAPGTSDP